MLRNYWPRTAFGLVVVIAVLFCYVTQSNGQIIPGGGPDDDVVSAQIPFCFNTVVEIEDPAPHDPANGPAAEAQAKAKAHDQLDALALQYMAMGLEVEVVIEQDDGNHHLHRGAPPFGVDFWAGTWTLKGYLIITGPRWLVEAIVVFAGME